MTSKVSNKIYRFFFLFLIIIGYLLYSNRVKTRITFLMFKNRFIYFHIITNDESYTIIINIYVLKLKYDILAYVDVKNSFSRYKNILPV